MKNFLLLILSFLCVPSNAFSQAPNNSCWTATDLGLIGFEPDEHCAFDGVPTTYPTIPLISDSTVDATPFFPYPIHSLTCQGFDTSITMPSNDIWYRFEVYCDFEISMEPTAIYGSNDSINLTVWHGFNCDSLSPIQCFTIIEDELFSQVITDSWTGDYFLQFSSTQISNESKFNFCLRGIDWPCFGGQFSSSESTDVQCFPYQVSVSPSSGTNGQIEIELNYEYGPFDINWSDDQDAILSRTNLSPGIYEVCILDNNGCEECLVINVPISTSSEDRFLENSVKVYFDPNSSIVQIESPHLNRIELTLYDASGQTVYQENLIQEFNSISLRNISNGMFYLSLLHPEYKPYVLKVIKNN